MNGCSGEGDGTDFVTGKVNIGVECPVLGATGNSGRVCAARSTGNGIPTTIQGNTFAEVDGDVGIQGNIGCPIGRGGAGDSG
ncbi:MAG: hypothetical protein IPL78_09170 [Chloroflexi bacterium]|nr:hypothetical protein [Chloroflexota bacterium]